MESALEYMANIHPTLANDYRTPDGKYSESCGCIAVNIARKLFAEGKNPFILRIRGELIDSINRKTITPKTFNGRISWGAHQVCCEGGLAYDPMVSPESIDLDNYCKIAFQENVCTDILVKQEDIKEFISR
jgi:hypothetical protein